MKINKNKNKKQEKCKYETNVNIVGSKQIKDLLEMNKKILNLLKYD